MSHFPLDDLDRTRLYWPEPLLIDLIADLFKACPISDRIFVARLQVRFLEELIDGNLRQAAFLRLELITACAARGIAVDAIEAADQAAFDELIRIAETRFRNSAKTKHQTLLRLNDARGRLPSRAEPVGVPAPVRTLDPPRPSPIRSLMRPLGKVAVNG